MTETPHGCCTACGTLTPLTGISDVRAQASRLVSFICGNPACRADARDLPFVPKDAE